MLKTILLLSIFVPLALLSVEFSDVLIYDQPVQISSEINEYENIVAGKPIQGSVMVTHNANTSVDANSFMLGNKPLQVEFVQTAKMSTDSNLEVSIYKFSLPGMNTGAHTLDPIKVKVGDKEYLAPPLNILVP